MSLVLLVLLIVIIMNSNIEKTIRKNANLILPIGMLGLSIASLGAGYHLMNLNLKGDEASAGNIAIIASVGVTIIGFLSFFMRAFIPALILITYGTISFILAAEHKDLNLFIILLEILYASFAFFMAYLYAHKNLSSFLIHKTLGVSMLMLILAQAGIVPFLVPGIGFIALCLMAFYFSLANICNQVLRSDVFPLGKPFLQREGLEEFN